MAYYCFIGEWRVAQYFPSDYAVSLGGAGPNTIFLRDLNQLPARMFGKQSVAFHVRGVDPDRRFLEVLQF